MDRFGIDIDAFLGVHDLFNTWAWVGGMSEILVGVLCILISGV